jgi:ankyrin repeat protein
MGRNSAVFAGLFTGNPQPPAPNGEPQRGRANAAQGGGAQGGGPFGGRNPFAGTAGIDRQYQLNELVFAQGGMTPLLLAARQGFTDTVNALLADGADINQPSAGDHTTPLLIATLNGQFDLAKALLDRGADPTIASENGATPLYAALNCEWAPKALYPQPRAYANQKTTYLDLMRAILDKGADPNVRLSKKVWYQGYSFDLSGVDEIGATPFWRAAYASDIEAMKLLVAHGADPAIPTMKGGGRPRIADENREVKDVASTPPVPVGGPGIPAIVAAAGAGYGEGFAANSHRFAPTGMLAAVKYLVEELGADVNAKDHEGNTALHNAAARGDVEMIKYLVSKGADVKAVNREGKTTADMANGPVQRIQPWPEALALLESLGAKNNHKCVSC